MIPDKVRAQDAAMLADWPNNPAEQDWYGTIAREFNARWSDGRWEYEDPDNAGRWHSMGEMIRLCMDDQP